MLIAAGSVDQTGNYVFEVHPEATKKSRGKDISFWSVAGGSDTMISLWNPLESPQDIALTFRYADGSGQYRLPVHLAPNADTMISVAELKMMGQPDINGKPFSPVVQEGSAGLTHLGDPRGEVTVVVSAGTFNVRTATCTGGCTLCRGTTSLAIVGLPSIPIGSTGQFRASAYQSDGNVYDVTGDSLWQTSNGSVVGLNGPGLFSGVAVGSAWITASYNGVVGGVCPSPPELDGGCQTNTFSDSVSVTVTPQILLGGQNGTNITNTTQSIVTGQQVVLYGSYVLPSGVTVTSQSWSLPGSSYGGYVVASDSSSGIVTSADTANQTTSFYWTAPANSLQVTFTLHLSNGSTATATTTFNVTGVTSPGFSIQNYGSLTVDNLTGCSGVSGGPALVYGNVSGPMPGCSGTTTGTAGIIFSAAGSPPSPGSFSFVQLINQDQTTYTSSSGSLVCAFTNGLDTKYPYPQNASGQATDAPEAPLPSTYNSVSRSFSATMYLLWTPNAASGCTTGSNCTIPVPLGFESWSFSGSTSQVNGVWQTPTTNNAGPSGSFTSTNGALPTWSYIATRTCN